MKKLYITYFLIFISAISAIIWLENYERNDIRSYCQTQNYEVVEIEHAFWSTGPFIIAGKGFSIFKVETENKNEVLWFRYTIFGCQDIYIENEDQKYSQLK